MEVFNLTRCETNIHFIRPILIRELLKFVIGSVSTVIYIRLIYVLLKKRKVFANVFYKFVIINGISSILCYLLYFNSVKQPILLYFFGYDPKSTEQWSFSLSFNMYLMAVAGICNFIGVFFMSFNRCTLILDLPNANYHWDRFFPYIAVFYITLPLLLFSNYLFSESRLIPFCEETGYNYLKLETNFYVKELEFFNDLLIPIDAFIFPACFISNILAIRGLFRKRQEGMASRRTVDKYAVNLLIICLGEFTIHFICIFANITIYIVDTYGAGETSLLKLNALSNTLLEMSPLLSCPLIIWCSSRIRNEVFNWNEKKDVGVELKPAFIVKTNNTNNS